MRPGSGNERPRPDAGDLYELLAPRVLAYLRAQGAPDCEDLLGEVFLQTARDHPRFRGDDDETRRWVFTIARNRLIDERRRRSRRPSVSLGEPVPDGTGRSAPEPFDPVLVDALNRLTPQQREVVLLRFLADLPIDTVARMTRNNVGAVKALQHRALQRLACDLGSARTDVTSSGPKS